jgi:putative addiction module killer protein
VEARLRQVENYLDANGTSPFENWMEKFEGQKIHGIILVGIDRVKNGLLGKWKAVGEGVSELIVDFGAGFRIYFGLDGNKVILLCGGTKRSQSSDISSAKAYWRDYNA